MTRVAAADAGFANNHQVFCVTHLPQVTSHLVVTKDQSKNRAVVTPASRAIVSHSPPQRLTFRYGGVRSR